MHAYFEIHKCGTLNKIDLRSLMCTSNVDISSKGDGFSIGNQSMEIICFGYLAAS